MHKILIVYYTYSKITKRLAEKISSITEGDIRELITQKPYSFNYNTATKEARSEVEKGYCPALLSGNEPVVQYDFIFIGTPNWFKSFAPPILSFLRSVDLKGKTVIPFCTHGGGGFGQIEMNISRECPQSKILSGFAAMNDFDEKRITEWLNEIGILNR